MPVPVDGFYDDLVAEGYEYGPVFQGVQAVWRAGEDGVRGGGVAADAHADAARFGLHPALLDAALHAVGIGEEVAADRPPSVPFAWTEVTLRATGATALRVRLTPVGTEAVALHLADPTGAPVGRGRCAGVPAGAARRRDRRRRHLYRVDWTPVPTPAAPATSWAYLEDLGDDAPELVLARLTDPVAGDPSASPDGAVDVESASRATAVATLGLLQRWLADPRSAESRLVVLTSGAADGVTDLVQAPVWGLVRAAQAENPGQFVLVDAAPETPVEDIVAAVRHRRAGAVGARRAGTGATAGPRRHRRHRLAGGGHGPGDRRHGRVGRAGRPAPGRHARRPRSGPGLAARAGGAGRGGAARGAGRSRCRRRGGRV